MAVLVCVNCGERYYDQQAIRKIELIRSEEQLRENRGDRKGAGEIRGHTQ
jgi:hypothetical protein